MNAADTKLPYRPAGQFGFSNLEEHLESARQYRDAAAEDGWSIRGTYEPSEPVDRAARLTRDGFVMQVITRDNSGQEYQKRYEASVHIWGPDGLAVAPPEFYDFAEIVARTRCCASCGKSDVKTVRFSFAGRCCEACLPELRRVHEQPGWSA